MSFMMHLRRQLSLYLHQSTRPGDTTTGAVNHSKELLAGFVASTSRQHIDDVGKRWLAESEEFCPDSEDFDTAYCAELPPEMDLYRIMADEDENFIDQCVEWEAFIGEKELWLPLEQSCSEGMLLPMDQRAMRLRTCPERLLRGLRWFFELCPPHVKHDLALRYYVLVRIDRARRLGTPDWRP
jgi:hypothetical protein